MPMLRNPLDSLIVKPLALLVCALVLLAAAGCGSAAGQRATAPAGPLVGGLRLHDTEETVLSVFRQRSIRCIPSSSRDDGFVRWLCEEPVETEFGRVPMMLVFKADLLHSFAFFIEPEIDTPLGNMAMFVKLAERFVPRYGKATRGTAPDCIDDVERGGDCHLFFLWQLPEFDVTLSLLWKEGKVVHRLAGYGWPSADLRAEFAASDRCRDDRVDACAKSCLDDNNSDSCARAGILHYQGNNGVEVDKPTAALYFSRACTKKHAWSCGMLGMMMALGEGVTRDPASARSHLEFACEETGTLPCFFLGTLYESGDGVRKDLLFAASLHARACEKDVKSACEHLAKLRKQLGARRR